MRVERLLINIVRATTGRISRNALILCDKRAKEPSPRMGLRKPQKRLYHASRPFYKHCSSSRHGLLGCNARGFASRSFPVNVSALALMQNSLPRSVVESCERSWKSKPACPEHTGVFEACSTSPRVVQDKRDHALRSLGRTTRSVVQSVYVSVVSILITAASLIN